MVHQFKDWEEPPQSAFMMVDSNTMHYVMLNQQKTDLVVLVHGSPGSWSAFIDLFKNKALTDRVDLLAIDRPGFGMSDFGSAAPSLAEQARLLAAVIAQFPHQRKILLGHSLGGPVIARIAMDFPELVDGLILVAPSIDPEQEKYEWYRPIMDSKIGGMLTPTSIWVSNQEILPLKQELERMLPMWSKIKIPTILIHGTADRLVPVANAEFAEKMIGDTLLEVRYLEGVDHFIPWTHEEVMIQAMEDLIR